MIKGHTYRALAVSWTEQNTFQPLPRILLVLLLVFLASLYIRPVALHSSLSRVPILAAGLAGILLIVHILQGRSPLVLGGRQSIGVYSLIAFTGLSISWSIDSAATAAMFKTFLRILAVYVLAINAGRTTSKVKLYLWALVLGSIVPGWGTLNNYLNDTVVPGEVDRYAWRDIFSNPNDLAYGLAVAIPMALSLREATRNRLARGLLVALLVLHAVAITLSGSRGGMLGLGAGLIAWIVFRPGSRPMRAVPFVIALALVAVLTAPSVTWERFSAGFSEHRDLSFQTRLNAWEVGLRVAEDNPLTGTGAGTFEAAWAKYAPLEFGATYYTAHNSYVQAMAELGLPGLAFLLMAVVFAMVNLWGMRRKTGDRGTLASGLAGGLTAFLVCSFGGGHLYSWFPYMVLAAVESLAIWGDEPQSASAPL